MQTDWPNIVSQIMTENGFTARKLADKLGVSVCSISRFLNGRSVMPIERLEACLDVLGYEFDAFPKEQNCSRTRLSSRDPRHLVGM